MHVINIISVLFSDDDIRAEDRETLIILHSDYWLRLHIPLQSVGFLLNPVYHNLKPWLFDDVMADFHKLCDTWDTADAIEEIDRYTEYDFMGPRIVRW